MLEGFGQKGEKKPGGGGILELPPVFKTRDFLKVSPYAKCLNSMYFFPTNVVPKVGRVLNVANKFVDCTLVCFLGGFGFVGMFLEKFFAPGDPWESSEFQIIRSNFPHEVWKVWIFLTENLGFGTHLFS